MKICRPVAAIGVAVLVAFAAAAQRPAAATRHHVFFNRHMQPAIALFAANADGRNERPLLQGTDLAYSPSYSADGAWIIYTRERNGLSDIFRVRADGTGPEQLTDDPAFDDQAVLSPDGRMLAFVSTRQGGFPNIWILDLATKEAKNLTRQSSGNFRPAWSPDGQWIAFSSDRDTDAGVQPGRWPELQSTGIYIMRPDGTGLRRLTRIGGVAGSPSWSADSRRVLFYETDEVGGLLAKNAQSRTDLASVDIQTSQRTLHTGSNETKVSAHWLSGGRISYVARGPNDIAGLSVWNPNLQVDRIIRGPVRNPAWSPDGTRVVYEKIGRIGTPQHFESTYSRDPDFDLTLTEPFPSFSPDRKQFLYSQMPYVRSAVTGVEEPNMGDTSIEIMNADGTGKRTLFHRPGFSAFSGVFSPRGDQIALSVGRYLRAPGAPPAQIALIKPDGTGLQMIVDDEVNNGFPSWSRDGSRLAFKRGRQLVIMNLADRKIVPLTDGSHYDNFPMWSPVDDRILFSSDRDGRFELYTINADGTNLRRLTNVRGSNAHAAWCSDGDWIVFSSGRMGFKDEIAQYDRIPQPYGEIFAMRVDGSDVRQLTDNKWEDASAACIAD